MIGGICAVAHYSTLVFAPLPTIADLWIVEQQPIHLRESSLLARGERLFVGKTKQSVRERQEI